MIEFWTLTYTFLTRIAMKLRADAQSLYLENLTRNKELRIMKEKLKKENKRCNFFSKHRFVSCLQLRGHCLVDMSYCELLIMTHHFLRKSPKRRRKRTKSNHQSLHLSPPQTLARSCSAPDLTHNVCTLTHNVCTLTQCMYTDTQCIHTLTH